MPKVVIFDNSVSYFTNLHQLHKVYGRFWDEGIPISLGITPALRGDVLSNDGTSHYYGSIPHTKRGDSSPFRVTENERLCNYLSVMAEQRLVEICLNGYHGSIDEFNTDDDVLLTQKIEEGKSILETAFSDLTLNTFVLPEKRYSPTAKDLLIQYDFNICAYSTTDDNVSIRVSLSDERSLFTYGPPIIPNDLQKLNDLDQFIKTIGTIDLIVLRQTYWSLFDDDGQPNTDKMAQWNTLVSAILNMHELEIDTYIYI